MRSYPILSLCLLLCASRWTLADDVAKTCRADGWDMSREIAAFGAEATRLVAGATANGAPPLKVATLTELALKPQSDVRLAAPPQRPAKTPMPLAGLAQFNVPTTGRYRVTVDIPLWLDAVSAAAVIPAGTFNGWHECSLFRKTVEYSLQAGQVVTLQFSGAGTGVVKVLIEPVPPAF